MKNKKNRSYKIGTKPTIEEFKIIPHFYPIIPIDSFQDRLPSVYEEKGLVRVTHTDVNISLRFYEDLRAFPSEDILRAIRDFLDEKLWKEQISNQTVICSDLDCQYRCPHSARNNPDWNGIFMASQSCFKDCRRIKKA